MNPYKTNETLPCFMIGKQQASTLEAIFEHFFVKVQEPMSSVYNAEELSFAPHN